MLLDVYGGAYKMKMVYKEPIELATKIKDMVDAYFEGLISKDKFEETINLLIEKNNERIYKNGIMQSKILKIIGEDRKKAIEEVAPTK